MKDFFGIVLGLLLAAAAVFGVSYGGFKMYEYFAPRYTAVDAKVFKESVQYNDGMQADFDNLMIQYKTSDTSAQNILKPIILHRFAKYDIDKLNTDQREFYYSLKNSSLNK